MPTPSRPRSRAATTAGIALLVAGVVAIGLSTVTGPSTAAAGASAAPVRIMPLGDSITGSPGCWRANLWNRLQDSGHRDVDFVGTLGPQGCGMPYDGDNEGHGGALVTTVAEQNQLPGWLAATSPDIVLMHFGTNDVWSNRSTGSILAAYDRLVDQMRAANPSTTVLVAQIIPMAPATCPECAQRVTALNAAIPGWAATKSTGRSPVTVVDQWTGFDTGADTYDGVHPNAAGDRKIADRWYPALVAALSGTTPTPDVTTPPPPTTAPPTTAPPTTAPPAGGCAAAHRVVGQWTGGYQGEVTVTNTGAATTTSWTVRLTFGAGQQISQAWNASVSQSGDTVTAGNVGWNGTLAPSGSATFGFLASWQQTNPAPTVTCTLG